jgi:hypothetical protein
MFFVGLRVAGWGEVENRRNVITGFHFVLMPAWHHDRQKPELAVGVVSREHSTGLQGSAVPGVEHGKAVVAYGRQSPPRSNRKPRFSQP